MEVLCVGNSFAVDVATYVHQIAKSAGYEINIHVLYIPGCPIFRHYANYLTGKREYEFYINGEKTPKMYTDIYGGLAFKKYDFVTFQQRSGDSVDSTTFFPELTKLMKFIRNYQENTKYILHKTWSYAKEFSHERYGSNPMDQAAMDRDIKSAYEAANRISEIPYTIPSGEAVRLARLKFGDKLTRDGYHLNERGRTLVGILWVMYLLGRDIDLSNFKPSGHTFDDVTPGIDPSEIPLLKDIAKQALENNKGYNLWSELRS